MSLIMEIRDINDNGYIERKESIDLNLQGKHSLNFDVAYHIHISWFLKKLTNTFEINPKLHLPRILSKI